MYGGDRKCTVDRSTKRNNLFFFNFIKSLQEKYKFKKIFIFYEPGKVN